MIMKVKDFIKILSKYDQEIPIGVIGHFGEFYELDEHCVYKANDTYIDKNNKRMYFEAVNLEVPYIGEEPD